MNSKSIKLLVAVALYLLFFQGNDVFAQPPLQSQRGPYFHHIESATSSDGLNWVRDRITILDHASVPCAIVAPDGKIMIYYVDSAEPPENVNGAESTDGGKTWRVLNVEISGMTGTKAVDPGIVLLPDGKYRLYYFSVLNKIDMESEHSVCSAISDDGVHFIEEKEVFRYPGLVDPDVFWTGTDWLMYVFSLKDGRTIVARSKDGLDFEYEGPLPLDRWGTVAPILLENGKFRLYAFNQPTATTVKSFVSDASFDWQEEEGVRLAADEGESITDPYVVRLSDGTYKMFFKVENKFKAFKVKDTEKL